MFALVLLEDLDELLLPGQGHLHERVVLLKVVHRKRNHKGRCVLVVFSFKHKHSQQNYLLIKHVDQCTTETHLRSLNGGVWSVRDLVRSCNMTSRVCKAALFAKGQRIASCWSAVAAAVCVSVCFCVSVSTVGCPVYLRVPVLIGLCVCSSLVFFPCV